MKYKKEKKLLVRQIVFRDDGSLSDVPARDSETAQLEKQSDLFQFEKDRSNLKLLKWPRTLKAIKWRVNTKRHARAVSSRF